MNSNTLLGLKHACLALSACLALAGCTVEDGSEATDGENAGDVESASDALTGSTCAEFGTINVNGKSFVVQNDRWGASTKQCVSANNTSFTVTASDHNLKLAGPPASYPSIFKGCHWGNCTSDAGGMMKQVSAIHSMRSNWSVSLPNGGAFDVAYDVWFNRGKTANSPTQNDGTEIMVWIDHRGAVQPIGGKIATANIEGATWDVWHGKLTGTGKTWDVVSYVRHGGTGSVNFDLLGFVHDARGRNLVQNSYFLTSVQAGFEIWQHAAGIKTNAFNVTVK